MAGHTRVLFREKYPAMAALFVEQEQLEGLFIGDGRSVLAYCPLGHEVSTTLSALVKYKRVKCSYCFSKKIYPITSEERELSLSGKRGNALRNDFFAAHPNLALELTDPMQAFAVTASSPKKLTWNCTRGHSYIASPNTRVSMDVGCGYCAGRRLWPVTSSEAEASLKTGMVSPLRNDYLARHPELGRQLLNVSDGLVLSHHSQATLLCPRLLHRKKKALGGFRQCGYCDGKEVYPLTVVEQERIIAGNYELKRPERNDVANFYPEVFEWLQDPRAAFKHTRNQKATLSCHCSKGHTWVAQHTVTLRLGCPRCRASEKRSLVEKEVAAYVSSLVTSELLYNDRELLAPQELDIYLPQERLAIEVNGDYWHSTAVLEAKRGATPEVYHGAKEARAKAKGVRLLFLWESQWLQERGHMEKLLREAIVGKSSSPELSLFRSPLEDV